MSQDTKEKIMTLYNETSLDKQKVREVIKPYLIANKNIPKIRNILKNICFDLGYKEKMVKIENSNLCPCEH